METCFNLYAVAFRFIKYTDGLHRYAIFEIGRIANGERIELEKAYAPILPRMDGDPTNGMLQKKMHNDADFYTVRICLFIGNILEGADLIEKESDASNVTITYNSWNMRPSLKSIKRMTAYGRPWFERFPVDWDKCENSSSTDTTKTKEEKEMNSEKIEFSESAPKKWVSLYCDLHKLFSTWCQKRGATLEESIFSTSYLGYPAGIVFRISRKFSSDSKDELKFTVNYDTTFKTVTIRFFADNIESFYITTPKERLQIRCITFCEPIFKSFIGDKPSEHQIYASQTNGDPESKTSADWKPVDVIREYFGIYFLDKIGEIFAKYIPKKTAIFEPNVMKAWTDPEYQFFDYIRYQFSKFAREWFHGNVNQIIKSINAVDWEVMFSSSRYRIELRHCIDVKDINDITNDNLAFYKIDPIYGARRIIPYGLDHEFGNGFQSHVELIYNRVRTKIKQFVEEEKTMTDEKKELNTVEEVLKRLAETLKMETQESKPDEPKFPHFSTSKDGVKLVTIPWDVYRTMANTQYGMTTTIVKDRASTIKDSYWNPKTGSTTILWADGSKTMSKPMEGTTPDPEIGFAICIAKKFMGGTQNKWRKWLKGVVAASAASSKKKSDKNRIKLEKQARARLDAQQITEPSDVQLTEMIETIVKENATRNRPNVSVKFIDHSYDVPDKSAPKKRPGRKKKTN